MLVENSPKARLQCAALGALQAKLEAIFNLNYYKQINPKKISIKTKSIFLFVSMLL